MIWIAVGVGGVLALVAVFVGTVCLMAHNWSQTGQVADKGEERGE